MPDMKYIGTEPIELFRQGKTKMPVYKSDDNMLNHEKMGTKPNVFLVEYGDVLTDVGDDLAEALKNMGPYCRWLEVESIRKKEKQNAETD